MLARALARSALLSPPPAVSPPGFDLDLVPRAAQEIGPALGFGPLGMPGASFDDDVATTILVLGDDPVHGGRAPMARRCEGQTNLPDSGRSGSRLPPWASASKKCGDALPAVGQRVRGISPRCNAAAAPVRRGRADPDRGDQDEIGAGGGASPATVPMPRP